MEISITIDNKQIIDCMLGAHSRYWADYLVWDGKRGSVVEHNDGESPVRHTISLRKIRKGVERLSKLCPNSFAALTSDRWDGDTGDLLLQMIVLGEVKYG